MVPHLVPYMTVMVLAARFHRIEPLEHFPPNTCSRPFALHMESIDFHGRMEESAIAMLTLDGQRAGPQFLIPRQCDSALGTDLKAADSNARPTYQSQGFVEN